MSENAPVDAAAGSARSPSPSSPSGAGHSRLILTLSPVRSHLHLLFSDHDAARLMRVSSSFTVALLTDYTFDHWFLPTEPTPAALRRLTRLYERYGMFVTRLTLQNAFQSCQADFLLPRSLLDLEVGSSFGFDQDDEPLCVHLADLVEEDDEARDSPDRRLTLYGRRMIARVFVGQPWLATQMNEAIPPGALPPELESLHLGSLWNRPLAEGVLPASLLWLRLGWSFNQPLLAGHLPSSLTTLDFHRGSVFNQALPPGVLPPSLVQLELGEKFNQPLQPGSLPAGLRRLSFIDGLFDQPLPPGVLPSSLTHLHLSSRFDQPLEQGSLPPGLVQLFFGGNFNHPIAGFLPSSLRELHFLSPLRLAGQRNTSARFAQVIRPGDLPLALESLVLPSHFQKVLSPGSLPESLLVLDLGTAYFNKVVRRQENDNDEVMIENVLPVGLRRLRMKESHYDDMAFSLPSRTQVVWNTEELDRF